jgi:hypothetical protein
LTVTSARSSREKRFTSGCRHADILPYVGQLAAVQYDTAE